MPKNDLTKRVITYLIKNLKKVEGRKKLVKLMFLFEHFDTEKKRITKKSELGNEFIIYHYGVFSFDIMNSYMELVEEGIIQDAPILLKKETQENLSESLAKKADEIISIFGDKCGYELETETLEMLNIKKSEKDKFFGKSVKELIKD